MKNKTLPSHSRNSYLFGRVSVSAFKEASITVEAAMAVPIFFLAVVALIYLMEIMAVQTAMRAGLQYAGKRAAEETYVVTMVMPSHLEHDIVEAVGAKRLDRSIVVGVPTVKYQEKIRIKAWVGYEKPGFDKDDEETVYVTETGMVYHKDYHCTYLELSIHMIPSEGIENLRNESGGKYYPCEYCMRNGGSGVYITDTGNRYHSSLSCSGLKRTVYAVPLSEVIGKGACSRCGR